MRRLPGTVIGLHRDRQRLARAQSPIGRRSVHVRPAKKRPPAKNRCPPAPHPPTGYGLLLLSQPHPHHLTSRPHEGRSRSAASRSAVSEPPQRHRGVAEPAQFSVATLHPAKRHRKSRPSPRSSGDRCRDPPAAASGIASSASRSSAVSGHTRKPPAFANPASRASLALPSRSDRKSTRLNSQSLRHLVCRLLLEKTTHC